MKILLTLLVLFFSSSMVAEDISDFQIEGMSIGDSALDYFTKNKIEKGKSIYYPKSKKYYQKTIKINSSLYRHLDIFLKDNDDNFIIQGIGGIKYFRNNIDDCYPLKDSIVSDLSDLFKDVRIFEGEKRKHAGDETGKSYTTDYQISFKDNSYISISCYDWSDDLNLTDSLKIFVNSKEIYNFLLNDAF